MSDEMPLPVRPLTEAEQVAEQAQRRRDELAEIKAGQVVCEAGRGNDDWIHRHWPVTDVTKRYIKHQPGSHISDPVSRFRREDGRSVPYSPDGGSIISAHCQRPKKVQP